VPKTFTRNLRLNSPLGYKENPYFKDDSNVCFCLRALASSTQNQKLNPATQRDSLTGLSAASLNSLL